MALAALLPSSLSPSKGVSMKEIKLGVHNSRGNSFFALVLTTFCLLLGTQMAQAAVTYTPVWNTANCATSAPAYPDSWNMTDDVRQWNYTGLREVGNNWLTVYDWDLATFCQANGTFWINNYFKIEIDNWRSTYYTDGYKDFSAYNGVCVTYSLTDNIPVSLELKSDANNYYEYTAGNNHYTINLPATETETQKCFYFELFNQNEYCDWWSCRLDYVPIEKVLEKSTGFSFKGGAFIEGDEETDHSIFKIVKIELANLPTIGETIAGAGTQASPYIITTAEQLAWIAKQVNVGNPQYGGTNWNNSNPGSTEGTGVYYELGNDIDLSSFANWTPIGNLYGFYESESGEYYLVEHPFRGNFDGKGHKIRNLKITSTASYAEDPDYKGINYGLFGVNFGSITNLGVEGAHIRITGTNVGTIAGQVWGEAKIENCYVNGGTISSPDDAIYADTYYGGIAGYVTGSIRNSYSTVDIDVHLYAPTNWWNPSTDTVYAGGIAGYVKYETQYSEASGAIRNSMALGSKVFNENGPVARIAYSANGVFANNKAFAGMLNTGGTLEWRNKGSSKIDGEDILPNELQTSSGYLAAFTATPWTYAATRLPGLNAQPVDMPEHLKTMPTSITNITISPKTLTVLRGTTQSFTFAATVEGTGDYSTIPVTYSLDKVSGTIAGSTTINSSTGVLTVASTQTAITLLVTANIIYNGIHLSDVATVEVVAAATPASISGDQSLTLAQGYSATSTSAYNLGGTNPVAVTITSNNSGGKITWNDGTKKLDIAAGLAAGTYTVQLKATNSANAAGATLNFVLTVSPPPTVTSVSVTPTIATVQKDFSQEFIATVNGTNNPSQDVTWTLTGKTAAGTTISSDGVLYIDPSETATTLTVTATSVQDPTKHGTATVTVTTEAVPPSINGKSSFSLAQGYSAHSEAYILSGTKPITVTLKDFFPATANTHISWNSATEKLDIAEGLIPGTYKVTIEATNKKAPSVLEVTITIIPRITGVTVAPTTATVKKGKTQTFTATVSGTGDYSREVSWSIIGGSGYSSINVSTGVLTVSEYETATSITVKATSVEYPTATNTAVITVIEPNKPIITTEQLPSGTVGQIYSQTLAATSVVTPITWSKSGNLPMGLTLSTDGKIEGTPLENGTFPFTVIATNDDGSVQKLLSIVVGDGTPIIASKFASPLKAWMQNGSLSITGLSVGKTWSIYTASGALVRSGIASSSNLNVNLNAASGVYLVKSNGQIFKVVNR